MTIDSIYRSLHRDDQNATIVVPAVDNNMFLEAESPVQATQLAPDSSPNSSNHSLESKEYVLDDLAIPSDETSGKSSSGDEVALDQCTCLARNCQVIEKTAKLFINHSPRMCMESFAQIQSIAHQ